MTAGCYGNIDSIIVDGDRLDYFRDNHFLFGFFEGMDIQKAGKARANGILVDVQGGEFGAADPNLLLGDFGVAALDFIEQRDRRIIGFGCELQEVIALTLHFGQHRAHGLRILPKIGGGIGIELIDEIEGTLHEIAFGGERNEKIKDAVFELAIFDAMDAFILAAVHAPI